MEIEEALEIAWDDPELASHINGTQFTHLDPVTHRRLANLCEVGHFADCHEFSCEHVIAASWALACVENN